MSNPCKRETLSDGSSYCSDVLAWRGQLDDCCGMPAPADLASIIARAPACLAKHGTADDRAALGRLIQLEEYLARHYGTPQVQEDRACAERCS